MSQLINQFITNEAEKWTNYPFKLVNCRAGSTANTSRQTEAWPAAVNVSKRLASTVPSSAHSTRHGIRMPVPVPPAWPETTPYEKQTWNNSNQFHSNFTTLTIFFFFFFFFFFFTVGGRNGASTMWRTPRHGRLRLQLLLKRCWLLSRLWKNPMSLLERHSRGDSFVPKYSFHMADARLNVKRSHASIITTISSVSVVITLLSVNPIYCLFSVGVTFDWHTKRSPEAAGDRRRILVLLSSVPMKLINQSPSRRTSSRVLRLSAKNWYEYQQWLSHCLLSRPAPAGSGARLIRSTLLL